MTQSIFISQSTAADDVVKKLRGALELHGQLPYIDSRELAGGDNLVQEVESAIADASYFVVMVSLKALASGWVKREVRFALQQTGLTVIAVVLPGTDKGLVDLLLPDDPLLINVDDSLNGFTDAIPAIFAAIGEQLPEDWRGSELVTVEPIEELVLELSHPHIQDQDGVRRVAAAAKLSYYPADSSAIIISHRYAFVAPFGVVELAEIRWYLESYFRWPTGVFKTRAEQLEQSLPQWGKALYQAIQAGESAQEPLTAWRQNTANLRFSVQVDFDPPENSDEEKTILYREAASDLLALPWEIMHDKQTFLSQGGNPIQVRRRLPKHQQTFTYSAKLPIRVLLLSPRPEIDKNNQSVGYLDHRSSAIPLVQAMEHLGRDLVKVDILHPPTFAALKVALKQAKADDDPYEIVHFDGHGVYDRQLGLGALCFEDPRDKDNLGQRLMQLVHADQLAGVLRDYGVPLVYLDACQTAQSADDPKASVAASLLEQGVTAVVAMSHSVLVATARRFIEPFYRSLAQGQRIGDAMLAGQAALYKDSHRLKVKGAGDLALQDWFVPMLYQEADDLQLFSVKPGEAAARVIKQQRQLQLGYLPDSPKHTFVGRSRTLLQLERLLQQKNYAVIKGSGGMGKTTTAVELVRWLVRCEQFQRVAFVSVESAQNWQAVLDSIGHQLLPKYTVAEYGGEIKKALQPIARALRDFRTLILIDNMESVLPDSQGNIPVGVADVGELLNLCEKLLAESDTARLIFTSRETLPTPFSSGKNTLTLGRLHPNEAIELVEQVMTENGWQPPVNDDATTPEEITELVETVNCHPRALVLLAREAKNGVRITTNNLAELMAQLEADNKGNRENSLYASVELSLRRLPDEIRKQVNRLAVFHGGGHLGIMAVVMGIETNDIGSVVQMLVDVGMAEPMPYSYLRLDPALPAYLSLGQTPAALAELAAIWFDAMVQLVEELYQQSFKDSKMALNLTLLELPNLLALLDQLQHKLEVDISVAEVTSDTAGSIEQLLADLGRPQALARAVAVREQAAALIPEWGHARFESEFLLIERLLQQGALQPAFEQAQALLEKAQKGSYSEADYDLAGAYWLLARVLKQAGQAAPALELFIQAQSLFEALEQKGERMAAVMLTEQADCLVALGQLDAAVEKYQQAIESAEKLQSFRDVAVSKVNLATVLSKQSKYAEAIAGFEEARSIFEQQNEPMSVATVWHQLGMVHEQAGQYESAEAAYRQSLEIKTLSNNRAGQASSLHQLGNLYDDCLGRPEEAVTFYRQAAGIFVELGDLRNEGSTRNNIADSLCRLKRYTEARAEIQRAIVCNSQFGHVATPWVSFSILQQIETAEDNPKAATTAWTQARDAYLGYRQQGGYAQYSPGQLVDELVNTIGQGEVDKAIEGLTEMMQNEEMPEWFKAFTVIIKTIITGTRDSALADDIALDYSSAAEILFLIERLGSEGF